jgi:hypothetical protein
MDAAAILDKLVSLGQETGLFDEVLGHEPNSAPALQDALTLAVWAGPVAPIGEQSGLNSASLRWEMQGRVYISAWGEPQDAIDPRIVSATTSYFSSLAGSFTLGGLVRCIDLYGMSGDGMRAVPGYIEQDKKVYRAMELLIPLLVNDVLDLTP